MRFFDQINLANQPSRQPRHGYVGRPRCKVDSSATLNTPIFIEVANLADHQKFDFEISLAG